MALILDLCGGTGAWSKPYDEAGYEVRIIDLSSGQDIRRFCPPKEKVHGILAAPPCDDLARSGARWWKDKGEGALDLALSYCDACLRFVALCEPEWWALENPVGRLKHFYGKPKLIFHPYEFGDPYTKQTCLWGRFNLPAREEVEPIRSCEQGSWLQRLGGKSERTKRLRSTTPSGFARAFFDANP